MRKGGGILRRGGEELTLLAAAAAVQLSQGRTQSEVALLAAFFTALGDNLTLILSVPGNGDGGQP